MVDLESNPSESMGNSSIVDKIFELLQQNNDSADFEDRNSEISEVTNESDSETEKDISSFLDKVLQAEENARNIIEETTTPEEEMEKGLFLIDY